ncbi:MAG: SDR family NAD(P)-dependent oxidoreductase [Actinomycetota bacterium]|nr:SDR family NAD(P)-dependent oxidoreductase [Actinomycetota bacterium]
MAESAPGLPPARHIVISGASSGIGLATAERFARSGDRVTNIDLQEPPESGPPVHWLPGDVTDWGGMARMLDRAIASHGPIDVVVANAGVSLRRGVLECTEVEFRRVIDVNLLGVFALWRAAAVTMVRNGGGVLLATASTNGIVGYPYYADYNASKAGVLSLCQTFALELAPLVRTATVSPGYVTTPMQEAEYTKNMVDELHRRIPLGRQAAPAEIAEAFHYLASPAASYLTGQTIVLDGGELAGGTASGHATVLGTSRKMQTSNAQEET